MTRRAALFLFLSSLLVVPRAELASVQQQEARWAFLGDTGTGDLRQTHVRDALLNVAAVWGVERAFFLGDNIYENGESKHFEQKFLAMYRSLQQLGVVFHAALGNHDVKRCKAAATTTLPRDGSAYQQHADCWAQDQLKTAEFGYVDGDRYYSVASPGRDPLIEVFVLDTNTLEVDQTKVADRLDEAQLTWLREALRSSTATWKVVSMHHPMYSPEGDGFLWSGHAGEEDLRRRLEPILVAGGVDVVFQGHNHMYARLEPQEGIRYFVSGAGGAKPYRFKSDALTVQRDDEGKFNHFVYVGVTRGAFYYCAIDESGAVRDSGRFAAGDPSDTELAAGTCALFAGSLATSQGRAP